MGGGAWRVKWHPSAARKNDLLVACMHDGFKVVRFDIDEYLTHHEQGSGDQNNWDVIMRFDAHTSLAYGVDWSFESQRKGANTVDAQTLIASGSFYDHALHLWSG